MSLESAIASLFKMSDDVWERHANPWSVWTRYLTLPMLIISIWSRVWIGWWSLVPIAASIIWVWINPRVFKKPHTTDNWASKAVFGERVWIARDKVPVPEHHAGIIKILNTFSMAGALICIWGLYKLSVWPTLLGLMLVVAGKTWFLDRMVWLYMEMKDKNPDYAKWLY